MIKASIIAFLFQYQSISDSVQLVNSSEVLQQVIEFNKEKKYIEAISLVEQINEGDSNYLKAQVNLIDLYSNNSQLDKAVNIGKILMKENKGLPSNFYMTLGNKLLNNGLTDRAIHIYQKGLENFPYYHPLIYNIGFANYKNGDYELALGNFQDALKLSPFYSSAHQMMGNIMAMTNQRTKAILSYMTYLAINPDENWALIRINNLVSDSYRKEGSIPISTDNQSFEYYDNLLKSMAALDDRYNSQIDFEAPVAQQCELLLNKLRYKAGTEDFWMNFYVPFFSQLSENNLIEPFIYFLLTSAKNDSVNEWLEKNQKEKDEWISIASGHLSSRKNTHLRTIQDSTAVFKHWYHENNMLQAIGMEEGELDVGPYEYYYPNGRLQARGYFSNKGVKEGDWYYYHDNGQLKSIQSHNEEGNVRGKIISYLPTGNVTSIGNYKNGKLNGFWEWYYPCGNLKEQYPYENGIGNGNGKVLYSTSELKTENTVESDIMQGPYVNYYKSGNIKSSFNYENGEISGEYISHHSNGENYETGEYESGSLTGLWKMYYNNGNLTHEGEFKKGNRVGNWKYYYFNGNLSHTEQYDQDSLLHGLTEWFDEDGILYSKRSYVKNKLVAYEYFTKMGELLHQEKDPKGNMNYIHYYATGQLKGKGTLLDGDINGEYYTYHLNGNVYQHGSMKDNNWDGEYKEYDECGILIQHSTFDEGILNGYYRTFHFNGKVKEEGWIKDGNIQQNWNEYYTNGLLASQMYYSDAGLNGTSKIYGPKGLLFSEDLYDDGLLIGFKQYDTLGRVYNQVSIPNSRGEATRKSPSGKVYSSKTMDCGENVNGISYYDAFGEILSKYEMDGSQFKSYKKYHSNGNLEAEGIYENDKQSGYWSYYFEDGKLDRKYLYSLGKREGVSERFYNNGSKRYESNYYQDQRNGPTEYYASNGQLQLVKYYKKDFGAYAYQYKLADDSMSDSIPLKIAEDKELKSYFENGKVSAIQQYQKNYYHGEVIFYDTNGQVISRGSYKNGQNHGKLLQYHPNGKLKNEVNYFHDEKHGEEMKYYENGQIKQMISWAFGKQNGWHRIYSENGTLQSKTYYWNDFQY